MGTTDKLLLLLVIALASALAAGCNSVPPALPGTPASFEELAEASDRYWSAEIDVGDPGVQALFFTVSGSRNEFQHGSTGRADQPITEQSIFQVASISKTVAAYGVLSLADRSLIDLDAPVDRYLSRFSFPDSRWDSSNVTVERLLRHTGGLSVTGYPGFPPDRRLPTIEESLAGDTGRFYGFYSPGAVRIAREPGAEWKYSGGGYTVLQLMIKEASGQSFADYLSDAVLAPLGMSSSTFAREDVDTNRLAVGHNRRGKTQPNYLFTAKAAAGLYSTADDLALVLRDLYEGYRGRPGILSAESYAAITDNGVQVDGNVRMALSFHLEELGDGTRVAFHYGANQGWQSYYGINIDTGEGIVILANSDQGIDSWIDPVVESYKQLHGGDAGR